MVTAVVRLRHFPIWMASSEEEEESAAADASAAEGAIPASLLSAWKAEQEALKKQLQTTDDEGFDPDKVELVGGVDISFVKEQPEEACAALVVLQLPSLEVVYRDFERVRMTQPYVAGFLAFREVDHLLALLSRLRSHHPELFPQVVFVDGNGILHPHGFGLASHLGVLADVPTIGVGKQLHLVDGLDKKFVMDQAHATLSPGEALPLQGLSGNIWGAAVRTASNTTTPIFVSVGHRISLASAVHLAVKCSRFRLPEPVRQADQQSRTILREGQQLPSTAKR